MIGPYACQRAALVAGDLKRDIGLAGLFPRRVLYSPIPDPKRARKNRQSIVAVSAYEVFQAPSWILNLWGGEVNFISASSGIIYPLNDSTPFLIQPRIQKIL